MKVHIDQIKLFVIPNTIKWLLLNLTYLKPALNLETLGLQLIISIEVSMFSYMNFQALDMHTLALQLHPKKNCYSCLVLCNLVSIHAPSEIKTLFGEIAMAAE